MPITPRFNLSQDEHCIILKISVPHFRVSNDNIQVVITDDSVLHFSSTPYLLILNFAPHCFAEQADEACAQYEIASKELVLRLKKAKEKEIWENLHLLGKLVAPQQMEFTAADAPWLHKVVSSTEHNNTHNEVDIPTEDITTSLDGYGFLNMFRNIYETLQKEEATWLEIPWNHTESREERRRKRMNLEQQSFDPDRYLQDLDVSDDYIYQSALAFIPFWNNHTKMNHDTTMEQQLESLSLRPSTQGFSEQEQQDLVSIPYPILPQTTMSCRSLLMNLLDILFAYVYDHLTTDGEATVESAWTVTKLSASLSCLEDWSHDPVETVLISSCRRTLLYPYLRNADLACLCWHHVSLILSSIDHIVRVLLQIRNILLKTDQYHYLSNQIWIDPYLAWIQRENDQLVGDLHYLSRMIRDVRSQWINDPNRFKDTLQLGILDVERALHSIEQSVDDSSSDSDGTSSEEKEDDDSVASSNGNYTLRNAEQDSGSTKTSDALLDSNLEESKLNIVKNLL